MGLDSPQQGVEKYILHSSSLKVNNHLDLISSKLRMVASQRSYVMAMTLTPAAGNAARRAANPSYRGWGCCRCW